jgi:hypothetical protein
VKKTKTDKLKTNNNLEEIILLPKFLLGIIKRVYPASLSIAIFLRSDVKWIIP